MKYSPYSGEPAPSRNGSDDVEIGPVSGDVLASLPSM
jgi:hypothetical protein